MADSYEITKQQLYILIASSTILAGLFFILGVVTGNNLHFPEKFPSPEEISEQVVIIEDDVELPESVENLNRTRTDTSTEPHVPNEGMSFYKKIEKATPAPAPDPPVKDNTFTTTEKVGIPIDPVVQSGNSSSQESQPKELYSVQVASVRNKTNADQLFSRLKKKNYPVYISVRKYRNGKVNYRVRVGPYPGEKAAQTTASKLEREERLSTWILRVEDEESN